MFILIFDVTAVLLCMLAQTSRVGQFTNFRSLVLISFNIFFKCYKRLVCTSHSGVCGIWINMVHNAVQTWLKSAESWTRPPSPNGRTKQAWLRKSSTQRCATGTELKQNSNSSYNNRARACVCVQKVKLLLFLDFCT
jgi:hypothetical protein